MITPSEYNIEQVNSPSGRSYRTPDGVFPSVTTVLSYTKPKAEKQKLEDWRQRVGVEEADRVSKQSTDDGTLLHNSIEAILAWDERMLSFAGVFEKIEKDDTGADKARVRMLLDGWRNDVQPRLGEVFMLEPYGWNNNHGYAGAIDFVGVFDDIPSIVDWKNSKRAKQEAWIADYRQQGAAYIGMAYRCPIFKDVPKIKQFVSVIMHDEGPPQVFKYSLDYILQREWPLWEQRVKLWHRENKLG